MDGFDPDRIAEDLARQLAEADQRRAANVEGVTSFAGVLGEFCRQLKAAGFRDDEAFTLVADFANALFTQAFAFGHRVGDD
jgi:hypothetical protein